MTTTQPAPNGHDDRRVCREGGDAYDVITVLTLLLGGFLVPVVGWLAGVVLLWGSPRWSTGQKWLGTLIWPGVVVAPVVLGFAVAAVTQEAGAGAVVGVVVAGLGLLVALPLVFARLLRARRAA